PRLRSTLFPYTTLFRSSIARFPRVVITRSCDILQFDQSGDRSLLGSPTPVCVTNGPVLQPVAAPAAIFDALHGMSGHLSSSTRTDRKSTRLNSSHSQIS